MAGYLGTLFMGGVGLRLVLPPATQFNKFVGQMQKGLNMAGNIGQQVTQKYAKMRNQKLQKDVKEAQALTKSLEKQADVDKMTRLKALLERIETMHGISMKRARDRTAKLKQWFQNPAGKGMMDDLERAGESESKLSKLGQAVEFLVKNMTLLGGAILRVSKWIINTWIGAIHKSTMMIITLGFQLGMITRSVMDFEKELINANSIFQTTNENLYKMSDELIRFGHEFGVQYGEASKVLYQFASAGLEADEAMLVLRDTMILTMAVQGDANTLGKLLVQTIKGFGLEMEQAGELTDKFAHTINKSLIEWKDLGSAVKFAMPFFVAAGQSVDQLLGSLQILTDRALEAGIAGRGLRQAIAQFVEHADDNNAAFRKLGVEILDTEGNMRALTDIALQFNDALGDDVSNMDIMMTLMDDLNVRGATAFVHLAQNAEEFSAAVDDLANSQGAANEMAEYQQQSLSNQVQIMKNAIFSVFYLSDATYEGTGALNGFDYAIRQTVENIKSKFLVTMADGSTKLTDFGYAIRDIAIKFITALGKVIEDLLNIFHKLSESGFSLYDTVTVLFSAIQGLLNVLNDMDPATLKIIFQIWMMNQLFGGLGGMLFTVSTAFQQLKYWLEDIHPWLASVAEILVIIGGILSGGVIGAALGAISGAIIGGLVTLPAGGVGAIPGAMAGAAMGASVGGMLGGFGAGKVLSLSDQMASGVYDTSANGVAPLPYYSQQGGGTMYVDTLVTSDDNLNYRASDSAFTTAVY